LNGSFDHFGQFGPGLQRTSAIRHSVENNVLREQNGADQTERERLHPRFVFDPKPTSARRRAPQRSFLEAAIGLLAHSRSLHFAVSDAAE